MLQHLTKVEGQEQKHKLDNIGKYKEEKMQKAKWKYILKKCLQRGRETQDAGTSILC